MGKTNWSLFIPIYNLEISNNIGGELRIEHVNFISSDKIPRIRKKLGLTNRVLYYNNLFKSKHTTRKLFSETKVYAFLKTKRSEQDNLSREFRRIKEAVYLLASSQFYRIRRYQKYPFGGPEFSQYLFDEYLLFENNANKMKWNHTRLTPVEPYRIDKQWEKFTSHHFFPRLLKILNGRIKVSLKWRYELRRAALLAGQSQFSRNVWEAFLYDMIALEILLTNRGENICTALIERVVSLFGWLTNENQEGWKNLIEKLYDLRCQFVHKGIIDNISIHDLLNADMLLANLLYNLCELTKYIKSKNDIINLSEKLAARRTLGLKMIDRPRNISFQTQSLSKTDIKKLEESRHWSW